jgi:hypothetical protein
VYAGAYGHGQRQTTLVLDADNRLRKKRVPQRDEQARVCIREHPEPSSSWERYEQPQPMSAAKAHRMAPQDDAVTSVRQGHGLRAGLRRCGRCGRQLQGRSWGTSGTAAR